MSVSFTQKHVFRIRYFVPVQFSSFIVILLVSEFDPMSDYSETFLFHHKRKFVSTLSLDYDQHSLKLQ